MVEAELSIDDLFTIISQEENHQFTNDEEFLQSTSIQIQDENEQWIDIKGLIKKQSSTITLFLENEIEIVGAETHLIMTTTGLKPLYEIEVGELLICLDHEFVSVLDKSINVAITDVFDFEVDSPTHLYKTSNNLIHHNTLLTSAIIKYANQINMKTITIVPSSSLLKQTHDYIKQFDIPVGMFGGGKKDEEINMVCTWQTLQNNKSFIRPFECVIWDECVHPSSMIRMADNTEKRIDTLVCGDVVKTINEKTMHIENKRINNVYINLPKSHNQKMYRITMEDNSVIELTGNHEVFTSNGWKRTDALNETDEIISLAEQLDYHLIELFLRKQYNTSLHEWFNLTPTTISRWKKVIPKKYINVFKNITKISTVSELINQIY